MQTVEILDPVATQGEGGRTAQLALSTVEGKTIGFIDNGKPNFHFLVDELERELTSRHGVERIVRHRKRGSVAVGDEAL